jgi:hypothetical protein
VVLLEWVRAHLSVILPGGVGRAVLSLILGSVLVSFACALAGGLEWTEGPRGQLTPIGVPGAA